LLHPVPALLHDPQPAGSGQREQPDEQEQDGRQGRGDAQIVQHGESRISPAGGAPIMGRQVGGLFTLRRSIRRRGAGWRQSLPSGPGATPAPSLPGLKAAFHNRELATAPHWGKVRGFPRRTPRSRYPMQSASDPHQDIRDAVRDLCSQFPPEYFRKIDEARGYPEAFVDALTKAGWLAALIPQEYGGSGLGL